MRRGRNHDRRWGRCRHDRATAGFAVVPCVANRLGHAIGVVQAPNHLHAAYATAGPGDDDGLATDIAAGGEKRVVGASGSATASSPNHLQDVLLEASC